MHLPHPTRRAAIRSMLGASLLPAIASELFAEDGRDKPGR